MNRGIEWSCFPAFFFGSSLTHGRNYIKMFGNTSKCRIRTPNGKPCCWAGHVLDATLGNTKFTVVVLRFGWLLSLYPDNTGDSRAMVGPVGHARNRCGPQAGYHPMTDTSVETTSPDRTGPDRTVPTKCDCLFE